MQRRKPRDSAGTDDSNDYPDPIARQRERDRSTIGGASRDRALEAGEDLK